MPTDKTPTAIQRATIRVMSDGGSTQIMPSFTGDGQIWRPPLAAEYGGRISTLETLYDFFFDNVYDPDSALAQNPDFDEVLRQHPDVHKCMNIREKTVAGFPWRLDEAKGVGDDEMCVKIRDYCREVLEGIPRWTTFYEQCQNAVLMGGQGHEFIWQTVDGYPRPTQFNQVHKTRFTFDRLGNMSLLTRTQPVWGGYVAPNPQAPFAGKELQRVKYPPGKFTYHQYSAGNGGTWTRPADEGYMYYGRGEDTMLYLPVTFDNFVLRFQIKWLEKYGIPLAIVHYQDGYATPDAVKNICESIRGESTVRIPFPGGMGTQDDFYKVEFVQLAGTGYQAFNDFHESWTKPRIETILLGGASQMQVEEGGYAASVSQKDFGPHMIFRHDARSISDTINSQLLPAIVLARFPNVPAKYFPKHVLEPTEEVDREMQVQNLLAVATAVPVAEREMYKAAGIEAPKDGEKTFFLGMDPMSEFSETGMPGGRPGRIGKSDQAKGKDSKKPVGKKGDSVGLGKKK